MQCAAELLGGRVKWLEPCEEGLPQELPPAAGRGTGAYKALYVDTLTGKLEALAGVRLDGLSVSSDVQMSSALLPVSIAAKASADCDRGSCGSAV